MLDVGGPKLVEPIVKPKESAFLHTILLVTFPCPATTKHPVQSSYYIFLRKKLSYSIQEVSVL